MTPDNKRALEDLDQLDLEIPTPSRCEMAFYWLKDNQEIIRSALQNDPSGLVKCLEDAKSLIHDIRAEYVRSLEKAVELLHQNGYMCDPASRMVEAFDFRNGKKISAIEEYLNTFRKGEKT